VVRRDRGRDQKQPNPWSAVGFEAHRKQRKRTRLRALVLGSVVAFAATFAGGMWITQQPSIMRSSLQDSGVSASPEVASQGTFSCEVASVHDGDTFRCADGTRVRLSSIDTPEMPGACRAGRNCAPGDPYAARDALAGMIEGRVVSCEPVGKSYNRVAAWCSVEGVDLSCAMLKAGHAVRRKQYDQAGRLCRGRTS
jgi:endonuclease YncB( thermonuclease family)